MSIVGQVKLEDPDRVDEKISQALHSPWLDESTIAEFRMKLRRLRHPLDRAALLRVIEGEIQSRKSNYGGKLA